MPEVQADAERAIRGFAEEGNNLIIATSFGYGPAVLAVAPQFPDIQFIHISGYQVAENVSTGFGKIEEPRYVSGFVAGKMSASGNLGYVAAFPIPEVIRGINAFTLGVRAANPEATVSVVWTNTWYDPQVESSAAQALLDGGADVIAQHQDTPGPQQAAEAAGKYGVGYNVDMSELAPDAVLTSADLELGRLLHLGGLGDHCRQLDLEPVLGLVGRWRGRPRADRRLRAGRCPRRSRGAGRGVPDRCARESPTSSPARS